MKHHLRRLVLKLIQDSPLEKVARRSLAAVSKDKGAQYDKQTALVMQRVLNSDSNCIDIGAYRGEILRDILRFVTQGKVFAFEPIPQNCDYILNNYKTVTVYNMALSDSKGTATFYHVVGRPARSGLKKQDYPDPNEEVKPIKVNVDTLDAMIPSEQPIDFIKIDVEGAELGVFKGALKTIKRNKPKIVFEHDINTATKFDTQPEQVYDLLVSQCNMQISRMSDWLEDGAVLSREAFCSCVRERQEFYFMAH